MDDTQWGVGNKADAKPFDTAILGEKRNRTVDLIFGEHPHGRSYNNIYARYPDGRIEEFDGHRRLIDITVTSYNYLKQSGLSGDQIRKGVTIRIFCDGAQVWEEFAREPDHALLKAHHIIEEVEGRCPDWFRAEYREKLVGRKVYYREVPAVVSRLVADQGCVIIESADGKPFPLPIWSTRDDPGDSENTVKCHVTDSNIWWFRDDDR